MLLPSTTFLCISCLSKFKFHFAKNIFLYYRPYGAITNSSKAASKFLVIRHDTSHLSDANSKQEFLFKDFLYCTQFINLFVLVGFVIMIYSFNTDYIYILNKESYTQINISMKSYNLLDLR